MQKTQDFLLFLLEAGKVNALTPQTEMCIEHPEYVVRLEPHVCDKSDTLLTINLKNQEYHRLCVNSDDIHQFITSYWKKVEDARFDSLKNLHDLDTKAYTQVTSYFEKHEYDRIIQDIKSGFELDQFGQLVKLKKLSSWEMKGINAKNDNHFQLLIGLGQSQSCVGAIDIKYVEHRDNRFVTLQALIAVKDLNKFKLDLSEVNHIKSTEFEFFKDLAQNQSSVIQSFMGLSTKVKNKR